jgi:antitoxin (DNA-binding transcriptional repressor) of toxin-antitoxin stability system
MVYLIKLFIMKTMIVGDFKTIFSAALKEVEAGEKIAITFGRKKEVRAMLVPSESEAEPKKRKLGILEGNVTAKFIGGHNTTEEEFYGTTEKKYFGL